MLTKTAQTPTNIAVIKYWGKRDETLILPVNDSISVTLDPAHLCTTTTVAVSPAFQQDRMWLNGKVNFSLYKIQRKKDVINVHLNDGFGFYFTIGNIPFRRKVSELFEGNQKTG